MMTLQMMIKTFGEALSHNALTTGIGTGAGIATFSTDTVALASNPVGWAALGGLAVGIGATHLADWSEYEANILGLKYKTDLVGHKIDEGIDNFKK